MSSTHQYIPYYFTQNPIEEPVEIIELAFDPPPPQPARVKSSCAQNVIQQFERAEFQVRTWAIALCKTSLGQPFDNGSTVLWVFPDMSALIMGPDTGSMMQIDHQPPDFFDRYKRMFL